VSRPPASRRGQCEIGCVLGGLRCAPRRRLPSLLGSTRPLGDHHRGHRPTAPGPVFRVDGTHLWRDCAAPRPVPYRGPRGPRDGACRATRAAHRALAAAGCARERQPGPEAPEGREWRAPGGEGEEWEARVSRSPLGGARVCVPLRSPHRNMRTFTTQTCLCGAAFRYGWPARLCISTR